MTPIISLMGDPFYLIDGSRKDGKSQWITFDKVKIVQLESIDNGDF